MRESRYAVQLSCTQLKAKAESTLPVNALPLVLCVALALHARWIIGLRFPDAQEFKPSLRVPEITILDVQYTFTFLGPVGTEQLANQHSIVHLRALLQVVVWRGISIKVSQIGAFFFNPGRVYGILDFNSDSITGSASWVRLGLLTIIRYSLSFHSFPCPHTHPDTDRITSLTTALTTCARDQLMYPARQPSSDPRLCVRDRTHLLHCSYSRESNPR
ncbi:hypothetical protein B0H16DRAFT_1604519 [Mycena metata]|uniref:Uncharacterized protein n=1 Tax=Mycena metata TaxID=1033252 RepID=A0AAD7HHS6_9AGAR|nr:hypothetical protein B0H16DRAFT_1604519 [Mycena metata]